MDGPVSRWLDERKKNFLTWYLRRIREKAAAKRDYVKAKQIETGRTNERVSRIEIYENDVRLRGRVSQASVVMVMRIRDGVIEELPDTTKADGVVYTDFPTMWGMATGTYTRIRPDGRSETFQNFDVFAAYGCGLLICDSGASDMRDLIVFRDQVIPFMRESGLMKQFQPATGSATARPGPVVG